MNVIAAFLLFLIFVKLFLFWLWLWQLKEYHLGRLRAHFQDGQAIKKIIASFWRLKYPKFTKKITAIFLIGSILAVLTLIFDPSKLAGFYIFTLIIFVPLIFQLVAVIWRKRLMAKAKRKRAQFPNLLVIGVTGSYGKTSTKEFLYAILSEKFNGKVLKTKEHQNSEVGISKCILNDLTLEYEIFVVEMGAYNKGGIKLLCDIAKPKIGILTGINEQHMATFGSQENIIKAKYELIESLPQDGVAFFNAKNRYCQELYNKTNLKKVLYGQAASFPGEENVLGAVAVAKDLGVTDEEIQRATDKIENKFPGIKIKEGINGLKIIDATYSANPDGVIANLDYLKNNFTGKKVIIMPCLIELGKASKEVHQRIGAKIAEVCDLAIITTKDRFKEIKAGARLRSTSGGADENSSRPTGKVVFIENPKAIFDKIKSFCREGEVVLLESRVPKQLIGLLQIN